MQYQEIDQGNYWQSMPSVSSEDNSIFYNSCQRTIFEPNRPKPPLTNTIVKQAEYNDSNISTFQPNLDGNVCNGSIYYNYGCPISGFNQLVNGSGEAHLGLAQSFPRDGCQVSNGGLSGVLNEKSCGFIKTKPVTKFFNYEQQGSNPLFNSYATSDFYCDSEATSLVRDPSCTYNTKNTWPMIEHLDDYTISRTMTDSQNLLKEAVQCNTHNPMHKSRDVFLPVSFSHRRNSVGSLSVLKENKFQGRRSGSLNLSYDKKPLRRLSDHNKYKSFRSLKYIIPALSQEHRRPRKRGFISSTKGFQSSLITKHKDYCHDTQSLKNADNSISRHVYTDQGRLITERKQKEQSSDKEKPSLDAELEKEKQVSTRTSPKNLFYRLGQHFSTDSKVVCGTNSLVSLCNEFEETLLKKNHLIRANLLKYESFPRKKRTLVKNQGNCKTCISSSSDKSRSEEGGDCTREKLEHKNKHPLRLHQDLWFNDPSKMNHGPMCKCSVTAQRSGIRHNIYAGENHIPACDPNSNNADRLYYYHITIYPTTNFLVATPTIIKHDDHKYIFEGFSMFSHKKLDEVPFCKVIRFNIEYTIGYYEENFPQNFTVKELNLFYTYLFREILELVDLELQSAGDMKGCPHFHFMPRFVRELPGNGKEILSMNEILSYLLQSMRPLIPKNELTNILAMPEYEWLRFTEEIKGMIVTYPGKKPCSLRVDQLDRGRENYCEPKFPEIIHFPNRLPEMSYTQNPQYQTAWREYVKFKRVLAKMSKPSFEDKHELEAMEVKLQNMQTRSREKRNAPMTVSSENFQKTGIKSDMVQHAMMIPVLVSHLRFHGSLDVLEEKIKFKFKNRYLLQQALTHPSYGKNFGTNPGHARNSLTNCGIRKPVYGDRKIHNQKYKKLGMNNLLNIMSRFDKKEETESHITHNERLEFLGDAVLTFITSIHLFHMFPDPMKNELFTYRSAIVENKHLTFLAKILHLEEFMLYDPCNDLDLRHAMANCFEAFMGALFLDGGIAVADKVFGGILFHDNDDLLDIWNNYPPHPLQDQVDLGDRKWIVKIDWLKNFIKFEQSVGIEFTHIRLLARAFIHKSMNHTNLTLGNNETLEFLGGAVLQWITTEYIYRHYPECSEGHMSLLRSSLVNNRMLAEVSDDLGMAQYALSKDNVKTKAKADLPKAFLGALYIDQDLEFCQVFCNVCFFSRLQDLIKHEAWNDPKSKLQQWCQTVHTIKGGKPEKPVYKVIECMGPTNSRMHRVAVYFKSKMLAKAVGYSIQQAEMNASKRALKKIQLLFPQFDFQRRVISKSMNFRKQQNSHQRSSSLKIKTDLPNSKRRSNINKIKEEHNSKHLLSTKSKTGVKYFNDLSDRGLTRKNNTKSRSLSRATESDQTNKISRSIIKGREFREQTKNPPHFWGFNKPAVRPIVKTPPKYSRSRSQNNFGLQTKNRHRNPLSTTKSVNSQKRVGRSQSRVKSAQTPATSQQSRSRSPQSRASNQQNRDISLQSRARIPQRKSRSLPRWAKSLKKRGRSPKESAINLQSRDINPPSREKSPPRRGSQSRNRNSPQSREKSAQRRSRSPQIRSKSPKRQNRSPISRVRNPQSIDKRPPSRDISLPSRGPQNRIRNLSQSRARSAQRRSRSPQRSAKSPKRRGRSPIRRIRNPQSRDISLSSRGPQNRIRNSSQSRARSEQRRSRSPQISAKSSKRRGRSPIRSVRNSQSSGISSPRPQNRIRNLSQSRARSAQRRSRSPQRSAKSPKRRYRSPIRRVRNPQSRDISLSSRGPQNRIRNLSQSRARSEQRRSRSPQRSAKSPKRRGRSPIRRVRNQQSRGISPSSRDISPRSRGLQNRIRNLSQSRARSTQRRSRSAKSPKRRGRSPIRRVRNPQSRDISLSSRGPQNRIRNLSQSRARSEQRRSRSPQRSAKSPKRRGRSPIRRVRNQQSRGISPSSRDISPRSRGLQNRIRNLSQSKARSTQRRSRSLQRSSKSPKIRGRSPTRRVRNQQSRGISTSIYQSFE